MCFLVRCLFNWHVEWNESEQHWIVSLDFKENKISQNIAIFNHRFQWWRFLLTKIWNFGTFQAFNKIAGLDELKNKNLWKKIFDSEILNQIHNESLRKCDCNQKSLIYAFICIVSTEQWVSIAFTNRCEFKSLHQCHQKSISQSVARSFIGIIWHVHNLFNSID